MAKFCKIDGCDYYVFSKQLCLIHWKREFGRAPRRTSIRKSVTHIAKISDKKKKQDVEYHRICEEINAKAHQEKQWVCFFCGEPLGDTCDHHHLAGKQGTSDNGTPLYLERAGIVLCHRKCHREYHDIKIKDLLESRYYVDLMNKIYYLCKSKYYNMKIKHDRYRPI